MLAEGNANRELRLAVVMSGGVSLAVWMGGVAAELLSFAEDPARYGPEFEDSDVVIDVIAGTSAGGLNGVLLASALAWGVDARKFRNDVRRTWLNAGSVEALLRSPWDPDPPSLFDGDGVFLTEIEKLLTAWKRSQDERLPRQGPDAQDHTFPMHLIMTTTALDPELGAYFDSLGTKMVEPDNAETITFRSRHFALPDAPARLALAARASSSFPGAFEPATLQVRPDRGLDMEEHVRFRTTKSVVDGGVVLNRPFRKAFDAIVKTPAVGPVQRVVLYVVPDPDPTQRPTAPTEPGKPATLTQVLGKVALAGFSQSLRADLEEWRTHALTWRRQQEYRYWLAQLDWRVREKLLEGLYPTYLEQRAANSARYTVSKLLETSGSVDPPNWRGLYDELQVGRLRDDWRDLAFPEEVDLDGPWQWGIASLENMAEIIKDLIKSAPTADARKLRGALNDVAAAIRHYRTIDRSYWEWTVETRRSNEEMAEVQWGQHAYEWWPQRSKWGADGDELGEMQERLDGRVDEAVESINRLMSSSGEALGIATPVASLRSTCDRGAAHIDQSRYRRHMSAVARRLAEIYMSWRAGNPVFTGQRAEAVPAAIEWVGDGAKEDADAGGGPPSPGRIVRNLLAFEVIGTATQPRGPVPEQEIDLVQISADTPNPLAPHFDSAAQKLTGVQLAHFGAFYKRSWRANDWMWGRLDGVERIARVGHGLPPSTPLFEALPSDRASREQKLDELAEYIAVQKEGRERLDEEAARKAGALQKEVLVEELPRVKQAIEESAARGGKLDGRARNFLDSYAERTAGGSLGLDAVAELLRELGVASERTASEIGSDQFTRVFTRTAAVSGSVLAASAGGLGPLKHLLTQVRNLVLMPFYLLASSLTSGSRTGAFLTAFTLIVALTLILGDLLFGASIPGWVLALAWIAVAFWASYAITRTPSRRQRVAAYATSALLMIIGFAILVAWANEPAPSDAALTLECSVSSPLVRVETTGSTSTVQIEGCKAPAATGGEERNRAQWLWRSTLVAGPAVALLALMALGASASRRPSPPVGLAIFAGLAVPLVGAAVLVWPATSAVVFWGAAALAAVTSVVAWISGGRRAWVAGFVTGLFVAAAGLLAVLLVVPGTADAANLRWAPELPSAFATVQDWIADHRVLAAALAIAIPTGIPVLWIVLKSAVTGGPEPIEETPSA